MSRRTAAALFFAVLLSFPLSAASTIAPASGSTAGGTQVTITGEFGSYPYVVYFGGVQAKSTTRVNNTTLQAVTPEHLPGTARVTIFEYDRFLSTDLTFQFTGGVPVSFERFLAPVFLPPIAGQFGSEFVTAFKARLTAGDPVEIFGLTPACRVVCPTIPEPESRVVLDPSAPEVRNGDVEMNGIPGRFLYVRSADLPRLAMNLRAFDRSRSAENFGTELPLVRQSAMRRGYEGLTLLDVPTDPLFRNTLRIYAAGPTYVVVRVESASTPATFTAIERELLLPETESIFKPSMATFTEFPSNVGPVRVMLLIPNPPILPPAPPDIWAFVSVTNNQTQLITTITPQP